MVWIVAGAEYGPVAWLSSSAEEENEEEEEFEEEERIFTTKN